MYIMSLILRYLKMLFPCYGVETFHIYSGTLVQFGAIFCISHNAICITLKTGKGTA